jgi:hypothetical protein
VAIVNGVTSIRDMGGPWDHLERMKQWRRDIAAGALIGPRIIAAQAPCSMVAERGFP